MSEDGKSMFRLRATRHEWGMHRENLSLLLQDRGVTVAYTNGNIVFTYTGHKIEDLFEKMALE